MLQIIRFVISIFCKNNINKYKIHWKILIKKITIENHTNFQIIKSFLFIGLLKIKKIVFHSISLKSSWLHMKRTQINQKTSIIDNQKSIVILLVSQIVSFDNAKDKKINKTQKITIV